MKKTRRILLAVTGLTPQVVTETLFALACRAEAPWIPDEIHLITTATGEKNARLNLLAGNAWFHRLRADYRLPEIDFTADNIHILRDGNGQLLDDIRSPEHNTLAADFITETVRRLTEDAETELHVSIAGGRKTMGYYLGYALSLFGRPQDRLSHVLVSEPYETNRDFYYPTPYEHPIHSRHGGKEITVDARHANVELANIPFVRLRQELPAELLRGAASFSQAVAAARCEQRQVELILDMHRRAVHAGSEAVKLAPRDFAVLYWLARRRKADQGPVHCTVKDYNVEAAREYLAILRGLIGEAAASYENTANALGRGMDSAWFSPAKSRLNKAFIRALGESGAAPYLIRASGPGKGNQFALTLAPEAIHIQE